MTLDNASMSRPKCSNQLQICVIAWVWASTLTSVPILSSPNQGKYRVERVKVGVIATLIAGLAYKTVRYQRLSNSHTVFFKFIYLTFPENYNLCLTSEVVLTSASIRGCRCSSCSYWWCTPRVSCKLCYVLQASILMPLIVKFSYLFTFVYV